MQLTIQDIRNLEALEPLQRPSNEVLMEYLAPRLENLSLTLLRILNEEEPIRQIRMVALIVLTGFLHGKALRDIELLNESFSEKESI